MNLRAPQISMVVGFGTMVVAMHSSAMTAILPVMMKQARMDPGPARWMLIIYTLVLSCSLVACGRLSDAIGQRKVYLSGLAVLILSSALLVEVRAVRWLLLLRALEGVGAAMISGTSLALIATGCQDHVRGIGWLTAMTYAGLAAGPILAGLIAAHFDWHSVFAVNAILCAGAFVLACNLLGRDRRTYVDWSATRPVQLAAPVVLIAPFVAVGSVMEHFARLRTTLSAAALLAVSFIFVGSGSRRWGAARIVPDGMWRFVGPEFLCYLSASGAAFVVPLYLIAFRRFSPVLAGFILSSQYVSRAAAAVLGVPLVSRIGLQDTRVCGALIISGSLVLLASIPQATGLVIATVLALIGIGIGLFVTSNSAEMLSAGPIAERGVMTGLLATARNLGMSAGVAIAGFAYSPRTAIARTEENAFREVALLLSICASLSAAVAAQRHTSKLFTRVYMQDSHVM